MRFLAQAAVLFAAFSSASASAPGQSEKLLRQQFQELSVRQEKDVVVLELCFDVCDVFQWRGSPRAEFAWDFVAAYEYKRGVGKESADFISKGKKVAQAAIGRMSTYCREDNSDLDAPFDCSWSSLAKSKAIRVGTSIYDEGERCFGWYDLNSDAMPTRPNCKPIKGVPWKLKKTGAAK